MKKTSVAINSPLLAQASALLHSGDAAKAKSLLVASIGKTPLKAEAYLLLGKAHAMMNELSAAAEAFQHSLAYRLSVDALFGLADVATMTQAFPVAEQCLRSVIKINPKSGVAYYNLATVLQEQNKNAEEIIRCLDKAISLGYRQVDSYNMIGHLARNRLGNRDLARAAFLGALEIDPKHVPTIMALAHLYWLYCHTEQAMELISKAMEIDDKRPELFQLLSCSFMQLGKHEECRQMFQKALQLAPDNMSVWNDYLMSTNYSDGMSKQEWFLEHQAYGQKLESQIKPVTDYLCSPDPEKKLRIGYVSPDFHRHPVAFFFEPVLELHDREKFEIYCYYNQYKHDEITARLKAGADCWRDVRDLSDDELAKQIRDDEIDVLVDLTGHTADNRLLVFARKPAPVQFTWLGYVVTTGMRSIDYIFTDRYYTPDAEAESFYTEKPVYLSTYRVFRPETDMAVRELPARNNGYVTFGSFNSFIKITEQVLELWARLLNEVPNSRLSIIVTARESVDYVKRFFGERGVTEDRLMIFNRLNMSHFLQLHHHVDIALDSFPFTGFTTSFHGLWMGVPMITLVGNRIVSRTGLGLLAQLGLEDFAAYSTDEYIERAKYWAANLDRLAEIRVGLRDMLKASPLMDEAGFVRDFENGFRQGWQAWCASR